VVAKKAAGKPMTPIVREVKIDEAKPRPELEKLLQQMESPSNLGAPFLCDLEPARPDSSVDK
jgi:hypothetical protein